MKLYRYTDSVLEDGLSLVLREFQVVKITEKTYFIKLHEWSSRSKQCRKNALRSFAYDTKEKAFDSYIVRKKKQYQLADVAMQTASMALKMADKVRKQLKYDRGGSSYAVMGTPDFYEQIIFD